MDLRRRSARSTAGRWSGSVATSTWRRASASSSVALVDDSATGSSSPWRRSTSSTRPASASSSAGSSGSRPRRRPSPGVHQTRPGLRDHPPPGRAPRRRDGRQRPPRAGRDHGMSLARPRRAMWSSSSIPPARGRLPRPAAPRCAGHPRPALRRGHGADLRLALSRGVHQRRPDGWPGRAVPVGPGRLAIVGGSAVGGGHRHGTDHAGGFDPDVVDPAVTDPDRLDFRAARHPAHPDADR